MMTFLKKYWVILLAGIIVLFLFVSGAFDSCSKKHVDSVVNNAEIVELRHNLIDSVRKISDKEKIRAIDSVQSVNKKTVARLKKTVAVLESDLAARIDSFNLDTTSINDECDYRLSQARSIILDCREVNDTLHYQLRAQEALTMGAERLDLIHLGWYEQEKSDHLASDKSVQDLRAELIKQTTSWKRNEKWVYGAAGIAIPILLKVLLK